ncbi:exonuclease domain-containing protein [Clostridium grantii]|uniref:Sporulation inhibitor KapD n=1 Tax=Clostridium grantii DSM 8605 TaxID=1121316 RepID=A0A1M5X3P3_9CLOT|nr:exonuclease domain-containing protein [Clostridium grantii]SHH94429.1 sporulation inhibitor KapD [Clostridium grantii DSM 8605]
MSFYTFREDDMVFVPFDLLAIDFEFVSTKVIKNKAKTHLQEIVEVGAILKGDEKEIEYSTVVKPKTFVKCKDKENKCVMPNRFTVEEINNGTELIKALSNLGKLYKPYDTIWMSWGKVEYRMIKMIFEDNKIKNPFLYDDYIDLAEEYRKFYNLKYKVSLDKALNNLDIEPAGRHLALEDSKLLIKIIIKMFNDGYSIHKEI